MSEQHRTWSRAAGHGQHARKRAMGWMRCKRTSCSSFKSLSPAVSEHWPGLPHSTGRFWGGLGGGLGGEGEGEGNGGGGLGGGTGGGDGDACSGPGGGEGKRGDGGGDAGGGGSGDAGGSML